MARLHVRTSPLPAGRALTLAEKIEAEIDRLYVLHRVACNERRPQGQTEDLIDGLYEAGCRLRHMARG